MNWQVLRPDSGLRRAVDVIQRVAAHTECQIAGPLAVIDRASGPGRLERGQARPRRRRVHTVLYAPGGGRVDLDEPGGTALAYQAVLAEGVEVKSRFGQWPTVLRDTTEIEASANPPAPELGEQLRGIAERMQAGYPTPATDATQCGPRVKPRQLPGSPRR